jgi:hypothetical protein
MKLHQWIDEEIENTNESRTAVMKRLQTISGVSLTTLGAVDRGAKMRNGDKARLIESATLGAVTLEDLL